MKADTFNLFHNVLDSQRAEVFNKLGDGFENWYLAAVLHWLFKLATDLI